jgi:sterol desaturase/sphingolipid hydroxylase (fatty acid hydroxylase superfamily)
MNFNDFLFSRTTNLVAACIIAVTLINFFVLKKREVMSSSAIRNTLATLMIFGVNILMLPVVLTVSGLALKLYETLKIPHLPASTWESLPFLLVSFIGFAAKDLADYWNHRLMHTKWIWPIHAVHHSDTHVNGFTSFRVHTFELVYMQLSYVLLLTWAGFPSEQIALIYFYQALHNAYVHMELDIDHGPLNWLIASPRFHRWHHADNPAVFGKNLANHFVIYDMLFGTYHNPGTCKDPMGAKSDDIPDHNALKLFALPFTEWRKRFVQLPAILGRVTRRFTA